MGGNLHLPCGEATHIHISNKGVPPHHRWLVLDRYIGTFSRESLPSTVLVLHSCFLQVTFRSVRCGTYCICDVYSTVIAATLL